VSDKKVESVGAAGSAVNVAQPPSTVKRVWIFPAFVIGLLGLQIVLSLAGVYIATRSKSFAVESDYYSKALHWDDEQAALRASEALGWHSVLHVAPELDAQSNRQLLLTLTDRDNRPLTQATVDVLFFHHAHASEHQMATLREIAPGQYAAQLAIRTPGRWEFRFSVAHDKDRFLAKELREIN
jgi:nitrogen fixation protein FixH